MQVETLADAARLIDAEADDLEWTVQDPTELPGMRRAAQLLRLYADAHARSSHAGSTPWHPATDEPSQTG